MKSRKDSFRLSFSTINDNKDDEGKTDNAAITHVHTNPIFLS